MKGAIHKIMKKPSIIFVRHGNTALNEDGDKIRGWIDVPLSPKGEKEAEETGKKLKGVKAYGIISSDLKRAKQTTEAIRKETKLPVLGFTKSLRPWHAGELAGKEANKIISELNNYIDNPDKKIPEGESFNSFKKRMLGFMKELRKVYPTEVLIVVSHHRDNVLMDAWKDKDYNKELDIDTNRVKQRGISPSEIQIYNY